MCDVLFGTWLEVPVKHIRIALVPARDEVPLAQKIQLGIEYDPHPPFDAGSPERADPALVAQTRTDAAKRQAERQAAVTAAAAKLG